MKAALLLVLLGIIAVPAGAQKPARLWLGVGLGTAGGIDFDGVVGMAELALQKRAHHLAVRGLLLTEPGGGTYVGEIGALYGRMALRQWGHAGIAAGLAYTDVQPCPNNGNAPGCHTVGLPIVAEAAARLGKVIGVGVQAFANLNSLGSYAGGLLFLQLGWIP
jgi:hypothetical protein